MSMSKRFAATILAATLLAQPLWAAPSLPDAPPAKGMPSAGQSGDNEFGPPVEIQGVTTLRVNCRGQVLSLRVHATTLSDEFMVAADAPELQKIAHAFGAHLDWDAASQTLTCQRGEKDLRSMKQGQDRVTVRQAQDGSKEAELALPAQPLDGAVNIPLSALEEFLDVRITVRPNNLVFIEPLIREVRFDNVGGKPRLVIDSTAPVVYKSFKLKSPDRYVIDVSGAVLDTSALTVPHPDLGEVRLGQFELGPAITRIVVPVHGGVEVIAPHSGQGQSLAFALHIPNQTTPTGPPVATSGSEEPVQTINPAPVDESRYPKISEVHWDKTAHGARLILNSSGPLHYEWQRLANNRMSIEIPGAVLSEPRQEFPGNGQSVNGVQLMQDRPMPEPRVRIVLDMDRPLVVAMGKGEDENQMVVEVTDQDLEAYPAVRGRGNTRLATVQIPHYPSVGTNPPPSNPPVAAGDDSQFPKISSVQWTKTAQGGRLVLNSSAPMRYDWQRLADNRMVVDIPNALLTDLKEDFPGNGDTVSAVRLCQNQPLPSPIVRVVIDLTKAVDVTMGKGESENQLVLEVTDKQLDPYPPPRGTGSTRALATTTVPGSGLIVLDPGHGGSDVGAQNHALGINEADVTLDICKRLAVLLRQQGWNVMMTRTTDVDVSYWRSSATEELGARVKVANQNRADIFLSVHCNASVSASSTGTSIHYFKQGDYVFASEMKASVMASTGRPNRGLQANRFYVLTHTQMPAVLVETAFISNPQEGSLLGDSAYRQHVAEGLAQGVRQYASRNLNWTAAKP